MTASRSGRRRSGENRVLDWQKEVARSTATQVPLELQSVGKVIINSFTTPHVVISCAPSQPKAETEVSTHAIIGTIFGASAGAAVAYAMTKGKNKYRQGHDHDHTGCPTKRFTETAVVVRPPLANVRNYQPRRTSVHRDDQPPVNHSIVGPRVETITSSTRNHREPSSVHPTSQNHTSQTIVRTNNGTKVLAGSMYSQTSHRSSRSKREKYAPSVADFPVPQNKPSALTKKLGTILPNDSISQISTVRSKHNERPSHHHHSSKPSSGHRH